MDYKEGKLVKYYFDKDENLRNIFFYISLKVDEFMKVLKNEFKRDFLCYWVDGIYFRDTVDIQRVEKLFYDYKLKFSYAEYSGVKIKKEKNSVVFSYFNGEKDKCFRIPIKEQKDRISATDRNLVLRPNHKMNRE